MSVHLVAWGERDSDSSDDAFLGAIGVDDVATDTSWSVKPIVEYLSSKSRLELMSR